jgi:hypothetical protein
LDVRVITTEELERTLPRQVLGVVDDVVAAVVPLARIALEYLLVRTIPALRARPAR